MSRAIPAFSVHGWLNVGPFDKGCLSPLSSGQPAYPPRKMGLGVWVDATMPLSTNLGILCTFEFSHRELTGRGKKSPLGKWSELKA